MIFIFSSALFLTLLISRVTAHLYHFKEKTLTAHIRKILGLDIHHAHIGLVILLPLIIYLIFFPLSLISIIILGISLSLIADQIIPLIDRNQDYFSRKMILVSILLHFLITLIYYIS
jgi:hypothetical protein